MEQKEDAMEKRKEKRKFQNFVMMLKSGNFDSLEREIERANDFARSIETGKESIDNMTIVVEIA